MKDRLYFYDAAGDLIVAPKHQIVRETEDEDDRANATERNAEKTERRPPASERAQAQAA